MKNHPLKFRKSLVWIAIIQLLIISIQLDYLIRFIRTKMNSADSFIGLLVRRCGGLYPAFSFDFLHRSELDIEKAWNKLDSAFPGTGSMIHLWVQGARKNGDSEEVIKSRLREFSELWTDWEFAQKRRDLYLQANVDCLNGKKSITQAQKEVEDELSPANQIRKLKQMEADCARL